MILFENARPISATLTTLRKEKIMPDPKNEQLAENKTVDPLPAKSEDPGIQLSSPLFGGRLNGSARQLDPGVYLGNVDYLFRNGDLLEAQFKLNTNPAFALDQYGVNGKFGLGSGTFKFDAEATPRTDEFKLGTGIQFANGNLLNTDWLRTPNGQIYGADSAFKLGKDGNGTASVRVDEPADTARFDTKLKFNDNFNLNADWNRTAAGQIYGADSAFKLGKDGNGIASFRVDEPADTAKFDTKLKFNDNFSLNADWNRTAAGQIYGTDSVFKLGKEGNGSANFRVDEPANTAKFDTKLKFNEDFSLNGDWSRSAAGQVYGGDAAFKLGKEGNGTAAFRVDEPNGTSLFNTKLKFDESALFNADFTNTKNGRIYGADAAFGFGNGGKGTAGFRVDEPAQTSSINSKLEFPNGNLLNVEIGKSSGSNVFGADGTFGLAQNAKGLASFRIDDLERTSNYKLGATFDNGSAFNAQLMADRLGTTLGLDGKFAFDKGAGSVMLDGKFGPRTDLGASINYKNQNLEYSGHIRASDEFGPFKVSEFGAKVSNSGNERFKFSAEAGYRPENNEYYGKVGITIQLGGGSSRPSRPISRAEPSFESGDFGIDNAVNEFKQKQSTLLRPENKGLYDQAVAGVEKLNNDGAKLPVGETAASLTLLAKQNGIQNIQYVALGNPTSSGQQNIFIGDGDPSNPGAKKTFMDKTQAATTSMHDSLQKLGAAPAQSDTPAMDQSQLPMQRRSAM